MEPKPSFEGCQSKFSDLCDDFFNVVHTLRDENKTLKLTISELTQELEEKEKKLQSAIKNNTCPKCDCVEGQEEQVNPPRKKLRSVVADSDLSMRTQLIPETIHNDGQQSSEVVIHSSFEECRVKQEPVEESNQDILQVETPLMDGDVDIKDVL